MAMINKLFCLTKRTPVEPKPLCTVCQTLRTLRKSIDFDGPSRPPTTSVRTLQSSKCEVCEVLAIGLNLNLPNLDRDAPLTYGRMFSAISLCTSGSLDESKVVFELEYTLDRDFVCPWNIFGSYGFGPTGDAAIPNSQDQVQKAKRWIDECRGRHSCDTNSSECEVPKRLLDIGTSNHRIKLVSGEDLARLISRHPLYICLSHCWGGHQPLTTTKATLASHSNSIPWKSIPRTYQDAITLTRRLDVRYIWIDSLCIVQDDAEDWLSESKRMSDIYSKSYVTIAATSATTAAFGLQKHVPEYHTNHFVSGEASNGQQYTIKTYNDLRLRHTHPRTDGQDDPSASYLRETWPLLSRAWVFQERLLSPRVLHFSYNEMFWECKERTECECNALFPYLVGGKHKLRALYDPKIGSLQLADVWREALEGYSWLGLTKGSDKLPALSGLASHVSKMKPQGTKYLAGLWSDTLYDDLMWMTVETEEPPRRATEWRAPSWSPLSIVGQILFGINDTHRFMRPITERAFKILDADCVKLTSDPYGQLQSGSLKIRGTLISGVLRIDDQGCSAPTTISPRINFMLLGKIRFPQDYFFPLSVSRDDQHPSASISGTKELTLDDPAFVAALLNNIGSRELHVTCLYLGRSEKYPEVSYLRNRPFTELGLVLLYDAQSRSFHRLGILRYLQTLESRDNTPQSFFGDKGRETIITIT